MNFWNFRFGHRLKCPMLFGRIDPGLLGDRRDARIWRAYFHPRDEIRDLRFGQLLALRRHLQIRIGVPDRFDERAFVGVAGDDHWSAVAAGEQSFASVERQAAFDFLGLLAVALVAMVGEDGPDFVLKEVELGAGWFGSVRSDGKNQEGCEKG